jgi:phytanoyl-CoA hydroxylase
MTSDIRLHPWNGEFSWQAPAGPFQVLTDAQAEQFSADGYVVLEGIFDPDEISRLRDETDRAEAKTEEFLRQQPAGRAMIAEAGAINFVGRLVAESPVVREFAANHTLAGIAHDLIGPNVNLYYDHAVYKKPEKPRRFPWHQDNGYAFAEPQQYLTCWIALTDATVENGCPQVAPGIHRLGTLYHEYIEPLGFECFSEPPRKVAAPVKAGGMVVFSSLTPHLTGPNTTSEVRKTYICQYAPAGVEVLVGAPDQEPTERRTCDDPVWQFPVLRDGRRVSPPPLPTRVPS